jgi:hypothetical protein
MKHTAQFVGLTLALIAASQTALAQDVKNDGEEFRKSVCEGARNMSEQLTDQAPIKIDPTTSLLSSTAIYADGHCYIDYLYSLDEKKLFEMMQDAISQEAGEDIPMDFVQMFFGDGGEGLKQMKHDVRQNVLGDTQFAQLVSLPFVSATARYQVIGDHISDYTLEYGVD